MKKTTLKLLAFVATLALAAPTAAAQEKSYVGLQFGLFSETETCDALQASFSNLTCEDEASSYRLHYGVSTGPTEGEQGFGARLEGGMMFVEDLEFTAIVTSGGSTTTISSSHSIFSLDFSILPAYYFDERSNVYGRLGVGLSSVSSTASGGGTFAYELEDGIDFRLGAGGQWAFHENFGVEVDYTQLFGDIEGANAAVGLFIRF